MPKGTKYVTIGIDHFEILAGALIFYMKNLYVILEIGTKEYEKYQIVKLVKY